MEQTVNLPLIASVVQIHHHQLSGQFHSQRTQADSKMGNVVNILPLVRLRRCKSCLTNSHNLSPFSWGEKVIYLFNKTLGNLANPPQHFFVDKIFQYIYLVAFHHLGTHKEKGWLVRVVLFLFIYYFSCHKDNHNLLNYQIFTGFLTFIQFSPLLC